MPVRFVASVLLLLLHLSLKSQVTVAVVQQFYQQLDSSLMLATGSCKTAIANYKSELAKLQVGQSENALQGFDKANSNFKNAGGACASLQKQVSILDSLFAGTKSVSDAASVLRALSLLKYKAVGYRLAYLQLTDSVKDSPNVTVLSNYPSVLQQANDSGLTAYQLLVVPQATYEVQIVSDGHKPYFIQLPEGKNDTSIFVEMQQSGTAYNAPAASDTPPIEEKKSNPYLWISIVLAAILAATMMRAYVVNRRKEELKYQALTSPGVPVVLNQKESLQDFLPAPQTSSTDKYFLSEIMMTAGPRKKPMNEPNADVDLGEDVCGFITGNKFTIMWLLDGTSDLHCLRHPSDAREYFSSRLLAQSIARKLKASFDEIHATTINSVITQCIEQVKDDWVQAILQLPGEEKDFLVKNIREGNFPECAATILFAKLTLEGALTSYRSGDCKMFLYHNGKDGLEYLPSSLASKNEKSNDRIFFRLILTDHGSLDIVHNQPLYEIIEETNIRSIISVSDGIGKVTETSLKADYAQDPENVREKLIHQLQGTEDDKALCIIEIKETKPVVPSEQHLASL